MTATISSMLVAGGASPIDYDRDVLPLSKASEGGSVTERHILAAAAASILRRWSPGPGLVQGLSKDFGLEIPPKVASWLAEPGNPHRLYDLLGLLKTSFLEKAFIQPGPGECIPAAKATAFARRIGAIPAYAYLGDVGESPTGDKKAERFEDSFLDELMPALVDLGFQAVTYMPPRNTKAQLARVRNLASRYGLMEISGVDINSSRQSFSCPEIREPGNGHLIEATWALIAHEKLSSIGPDFGLFSPQNPLAESPLPARLGAYARIGRALDLTKPEDPDMLKRLVRQGRS
jgi:hypothetical protein